MRQSAKILQSLGDVVVAVGRMITVKKVHRNNERTSFDEDQHLTGRNPDLLHERVPDDQQAQFAP